MARHDQAACDLCRHEKLEGWWGVTGLFHCSDCGRSWSGLAEAHCVSCHRHFSTNGNADRHDVGGECLSDRTLGRRGLRVVETERGPIWKRPPRSAELAPLR